MIELGQAIRSRRMALGLTLEALAGRAGVSRAMLSDIEREVKNPTIKLLCQIAAGLECNVSFLLGEQEPLAQERLQILRKDERQMLIEPCSGIERHLLAPAFQHRGIEVLWYVIPPDQRTGAFPPHRQGVEEHITIVQGRLHCCVGTQEVDLEAGDALFFEADVSHDFSNPGPGPCHYFLIINASRVRDMP